MNTQANTLPHSWHVEYASRSVRYFHLSLAGPQSSTVGPCPERKLCLFWCLVRADTVKNIESHLEQRNFLRETRTWKFRRVRWELAEKGRKKCRDSCEQDFRWRKKTSNRSDKWKTCLPKKKLCWLVQSGHSNRIHLGKKQKAQFYNNNTIKVYRFFFSWAAINACLQTAVNRISSITKRSSAKTKIFVEQTRTPRSQKRHMIVFCSPLILQ